MRKLLLNENVSLFHHLRSVHLSPRISSSHVNQMVNKCTNRLWRSYFYVPGNRSNMVLKMANFYKNITNLAYQLPDLIVLDCEDAVATNQKVEARNIIVETLSAFNGGRFRVYREVLKRNLVIRINSLDSGHAMHDLNAIMTGVMDSVGLNGGHWPGPDMICLPKVEQIDELKWLSDSINQYLKNYSQSFTPHIDLIAIIESCKAIANLPVLCEAAKQLKIPLVALVFGSDDYCVSLGINRSHDNLELSYPRQYIPIISNAFGLASIDMVDIDFKDTGKLDMNCVYGARMGFSGKQTIHPSQLEIVNKAYSPSLEQIAWSKQLLTEVNSQLTDGQQPTDIGSFNFMGRMIDRPTIKQAVNVANMSGLLELNGNDFI